jgi:electron transfer flavoprotein alpha subunit
MNATSPVPIRTAVLATGNRDRRWDAATLELLGDASALAKRLNGRTAAWVVTNNADDDSLANYGCDVLLGVRHDRVADGSPETVAAALASTLPTECRVIFLTANTRGEEIAALLAARLDVAWVPDTLGLAVTRRGDIEITAQLPAGQLSRVFRSAGERPIIVTMRPGVAEARREAMPRPLERRDLPVDLNDLPQLTTIERLLPADPKTVDIVYAQRIVSAGRGTGGPDGVRMVARLAEALHAALAASRVVVDLGWLPPERQVGQTGKTVHPDLYVACGISGASHHLAGMRDSKHIVAINSDSKAPIHDLAHLSLHGDLQAIIPAVCTALDRRKSTTSTSTTPSPAESNQP